MQQIFEGNIKILQDRFPLQHKADLKPAYLAINITAKGDIRRYPTN